MARDAYALLSRFEWASAGDVSPPSDYSIVRSEGFSNAFDPGGSSYPERELFNQLFRELYALTKELNESGLLEWSGAVDYIQHARVRGSDGEIYRANISNGPTRGNALDPATKTDDAIWLESDVSVDLSGFLTSSSLAAQLGEYVTEVELNSELASYATRTYVDDEIDDLIDGAPSSRNTLKELSDAIDGRASSSHSHSQYASSTHVHSNYALLDSPVFTGTPEAPSPSLNDDSERIATTAWAQDEFAQRSHGHSYASTNHSHSQYATSSHTHSQYASSGHTHSQYLTSLPTHSHSGHLTGASISVSRSGLPESTHGYVVVTGVSLSTTSS